MSKVILCAGRKAETPYLFRPSGVKLYTIEELCYSLFNALDLLDDSVIDHEMAAFISKELGMPERGELLDKLIANKADMKAKLVVIFCSCDYFDKNEIELICGEVDKLDKMPAIGRQKRRADRYLKQGDAAGAQREYQAIVSSSNVGLLSPQEYGGVLHNLGVLEARNGFFETAAEYFREAYERNEEEESLKAYLFALKLEKKESKYLEEAVRLSQSQEFLGRLEQELEHLDENLMQSGQMDEVNRLKLLAQQGRTSEYDRLSAELIGGLKRSYRASGD